MKASANITQTPGVRRVSISAALLAFFLLIAEPAYASSNLEFSVSIPSVQSNLEVATPEVPDAEFDPTPSLLELDAIKTVDADSMALVSLAARKVEASPPTRWGKADRKRVNRSKLQMVREAVHLS